MKNLPVNKLISLINAVKGKKPVVIIASVVAIAIAIFGISKGYISEDMLNVDAVVGFIDGVVGKEAEVIPVVDTPLVDVVMDTLSN
jgi:hypothetical protein